MGFRNDNTGYPNGLLGTRSIIKKGNFALIEKDGLVKNVIPGFTGADVTILSSPKLGATFVDYLLTMPAGGKNEEGFGGDGIECLLYVLRGEMRVKAGEQAFTLTQGGYIYCPPDKKLTWNADGATECFLYKRRYKPAAVPPPEVVCQNIQNVSPIHYEDMDNVLLWDLLPKDERYDMNFHILSFKPGASHGYVETHVQEHGALILTGQGMYRLDDIWVPVQQGDYIFMGAYTPQAAYGVGKEDFAYLYSKDCNRDEDLP